MKMGLAVAGDFLSDFEKHCSQDVRSTELVLCRSLKQRYPDYYFTQIDEYACDLEGFAAHKFATCELENEDDSYAAEMSFVINPFRHERKTSPGNFASKPWFARYKYTWNGTVFLYYVVRPIGPHGFPKPYHFLLFPRDEKLTPHHLTPAAEALLQAVGIWTIELHDEVYVFDSAEWFKSRELWKSTETSSWDDVVLEPAMKDGLIEDVEGFFDSEELYKEFQVPWKRGIILHGLPGNGKTVSIKALMSRLRKRDNSIPSLYVKSFEDQCSGPQYAIKQVFGRARKMAPCLLIFEDLDSLVTEKTRSYFLNEVDGLESNDGILMIGSTNHLDKLDPAIRDRPSRFDRKYYYRLPAHAERAAYARYWKAKVDKSPRVDFPEDACEFIATITDGFSFAYLKELFIVTLLTIARGGKGDESVTEAVTPESVVVVPSVANDADGDETEKAGVGDDDNSESQAQTTQMGKKPSKRAEELKRKLEAARIRRDAVAQVELPENLQDNVLVKVIRQQIHTLLKEMDNNEISSIEENYGNVDSCEDDSKPRFKIQKITRAVRATRFERTI
ncbi:hypothetical protein DL762_000338 [Monosporascus cannonballus]|uniref:AAA+ ATPase domain-containing protein n=1 Tax=Monosporascus cannonballus TaxID=155416 RepID=A0ABY0HK35_9PEZI|nr:hypothetical protein DL762_000338 [Monosporascus cannonballus]